MSRTAVTGVVTPEARAAAMIDEYPVLAVTAYAGKGDEDRIREVGAEGYLAKPVSIVPFMTTVRELLGIVTAQPNPAHA